MSDDSMQKKDIDLLPDDLRRDVKSSLSMNIKKSQEQQREIAPLAREASSYKPSLFARLFAKPFGPREEKQEYQKPQHESLDKSGDIPKIRIKDETNKADVVKPEIPRPHMESVQPHMEHKEEKASVKPIQYKPEKEGFFARLGRMFSRTTKSSTTETTPDTKDVQFTKGAKSSVTIHVKDMAVHAPDIKPQEKKIQEPEEKKAEAPPTKPDKVVLRKIEDPKPKPAPKPPVAEPAHSDITIHVKDPKPASEKPAPEPIPEAKPVEKPEAKNTQPDRSALHLSSIKDMVHHQAKEDANAKDEFEDHEAFGVNLIPTELQSEVAFKKVVQQIILTAVASLVIVGIAYIGLTVVASQNEQKIADLEAQTIAYENQIRDSSEVLDQLATFTEQTQKVGELLHGRERWTELFSMLEAETLPEVYYKSIAIDSSDRVSLEVVAKSYFDLARQYKVFEQHDKIGNISFSTASMSTELLDEYVMSVKEQLVDLEAAGASVTSTQQLLNRDRLQALLTVDTSIAFDFSIQSASSTLDRYE